MLYLKLKYLRNEQTEEEGKKDQDIVLRRSLLKVSKGSPTVNQYLCAPSAICVLCLLYRSLFIRAQDTVSALKYVFVAFQKWK